MTKLVILLVSVVLAGKIQLSAESEKYKNLFGNRFSAINNFRPTDDEGKLKV